MVDERLIELIMLREIIKEKRRKQETNIKLNFDLEVPHPFPFENTLIKEDRRK